jgi:hypothetical protein
MAAVLVQEIPWPLLQIEALAGIYLIEFTMFYANTKQIKSQ